MPASPKIACKNIWKIFRPHPKRTLDELDMSLDRAKVQERTGHVIAVRDDGHSLIHRAGKQIS
jgi:ABC-type proline/glycine betaine transport system ATPase subunit